MFKTTLLTTAMLLSVAAFQPALAEEPSDTDLSKTAPRERYKNMSDDERKAFHEKRKEKWQGMSKEEKLEVIEKRRAEKIKKMEEKWNSMSDDEKISFVEKRMKGHHGGRAGYGEHESRGEYGGEGRGRGGEHGGSRGGHGGGEGKPEAGDKF